MPSPDVRYWRKADIRLTRLECPLLTQSGHCSSSSHGGKLEVHCLLQTPIECERTGLTVCQMCNFHLPASEAGKDIWCLVGAGTVLDTVGPFPYMHFQSYIGPNGGERGQGWPFPTIGASMPSKRAR